MKKKTVLHFNCVNLTTFILMIEYMSYMPTVCQQLKIRSVLSEEDCGNDIQCIY